MNVERPAPRGPTPAGRQFPLECEGCSRWFGHIRSYDRHAVADGCADTAYLRDLGMIQDSDGVWWQSRP